MKGKYGGPMAVDDLFQALWQDREFFRKHGITHVRNTFLYFTPCDRRGNAVLIGDERGSPIDGYETSGGYHSAADDYDHALEARPIPRGLN